MNGSLISCIVPVYNGSRYLGETLDSIAAQTYKAVEVIVVDDGSTDLSAEIARQHSTGPRVYSQANAGPAAARNSGISHANGEFFAFLDADDIWHQEKLELQMNLLHERREVGFCVTHVQNFWIPELRSEQERYEGTRMTGPVPGYSGSTLLVRSNAFRIVGTFCESMSHTSEPDWFLRARNARVRGELLSEVLVRRRIHHSNRSRLRSANSTEEYLRFIKAKLDHKRNDP